MSKKVLGVYNSTDDVIFAIEEFRNEGYSVNELSIIANTRDVPSSIQYETGVTTEELSGTTNTRTPKDTGLLSSLVSSLMVNTKTDEDETSYFDHLVGLGFNEGSAREYEEDINSGRILLLSDSGAGNTGTSVGAFTGTTALEQTGLDADTLGTDEERSLKLREEQLDVSKESVQTGEVEVHKDVVEEQKTVHVPVTHEEVYVERRKVDDATADTTTPIGEDETIRVPIVEEKVEVTKKPVVTEELVIGKRQTTEAEQVTEKIKREEAKVETDGDTTVTETTIDRTRLDHNRL
jgi:uncharacterized protein (TIGR02271 family)